jgi:Transglutaminase-like superfamily
MTRLWLAIRQKVRVARQQSWIVLALFPIAWLAIAFAALLILTVPFRRMVPWLGRNHGAVALTPLGDKQTDARAVYIAKAMAIAARNAPFRSDCLPQALAAVFLCRLARIPTALHLGVATGIAGAERRLDAHAWVQSGQVNVTGNGNSPKHFGPVACFVRT